VANKLCIINNLPGLHGAWVGVPNSTTAVLEVQTPISRSPAGRVSRILIFIFKAPGSCNLRTVKLRLLSYKCQSINGTHLLCLPTYSHFLIVNKTSLALTLPPSPLPHSLPPASRSLPYLSHSRSMSLACSLSRYLSRAISLSSCQCPPGGSRQPVVCTHTHTDAHTPGPAIWSVVPSKISLCLSVCLSLPYNLTNHPRSPRS
jgi:hypothetical protein